MTFRKWSPAECLWPPADLTCLKRPGERSQTRPETRRYRTPSGRSPNFKHGGDRP
jgi:hypothetical protein